MTLKLILTFSILFQVIAAALALSLIRVTGRRIAWVVISAAILLMVFRRLFTLGHMVMAPSAVLSDMATELIALATSLLMMGGIAAIRPIFQAMNEAQEKILKKEAVLAAHARELERSNRDLEQFAYVASHDLQGPLRTINNYVQLFARKYQGWLDENAEKYIGYIVEGTQRMQHLIDDLLIYSRVGHRQEPCRRISLEAVLDEVCRDLADEVEKSGARITRDPLPECLMEPLQAAQLLQNLIGNSLKFRREEVPPLIHVAARAEDSWWVLSVRDNGIGIAPEFTDRVFGVFQRLHTRREFPGTGIGLAICQKIVENHGGRIWLASVPGEGTTVYFTLPMDRPEAALPPGAVQAREHGGASAPGKEQGACTADSIS